MNPVNAPHWLAPWDAFIRVADGGSMAAAARALGCTRAQVSKQMAELERRLGARLFERSTRRLHLTPEGEVFRQHALQALAAVDTAEVALRNPGDAPRGLLRLSASVTFGRLHVAPLLPPLLARHPELEIDLVLTDALVDLEADDIDLALRMTKAPPDEAVARRLVDFGRQIFAAPAYLAAHGTPRTPQDLSHHTCFSYRMREERVWTLRDAQGQEVRVPVRSRLHVNHPEWLLDVALAGQGLVVLPSYLSDGPLARGELVPVLPDWAPQATFGNTLYACYRPSRARTPKVRVMLQALEAAYQPVPPWACG